MVVDRLPFERTAQPYPAAIGCGRFGAKRITPKDWADASIDASEIERTARRRILGE